MKPHQNIHITKASGQVVPFSEEKLRNSLIRSGANNDQIEKILSEISAQLFEGISTKKLYQLAFNMLKGTSSCLAAKYHLKKAIMELGPSGYPFEKFIGELLKRQGYSVVVGEIVKGKCVNHEIDVIAVTEHQQFMIECKYHNLQGIICDVKIPLYIQSRFKDVEAEWLKLPGHDQMVHRGWVVTNTKFSTDAIKYAACVGLKLLGWDYPIKEGLKELIDTFELFPITCLTTLSSAEKQKLLDKKIVLCQEITKDKKLLYDIGMKESRVKNTIAEATQLCIKTEPTKSESNDK